MMQCEEAYRIEEFGPPLVAPPVVSVLMITYNHVAYIREAVESVFAQSVDFPIELVIGEDDSTDGTKAVLKELCADAPICVRLISSGRNLGMQANFRRTWNETRGQFIALLEGDDAFVDRFKLKKQVDMLNTHCALSAVASKARIKFDDPTPTQLAAWTEEVIPGEPRGDVSLDRILDFNFMVPTASLMIRKSAIGDLPLWLKKLPMADWFLTVSATMKGGLYIMPDCMSLYRVHRSGLTGKTSGTKFKVGQIRLLMQLHDSAGSNKLLIRQKLYVLLRSLVYGFEVCSDVVEARKWLMRWIFFQIRVFDFNVLPFRWYIRLLLPRTYSIIKSSLKTLCSFVGLGTARQHKQP